MYCVCMSMKLVDDKKERKKEGKKDVKLSNKNNIEKYHLLCKLEQQLLIVQLSHVSDR